MADTDDPVATVLNTPELLENILLRLDERTLLLSQRVSKTFNATINGSVKLQRKLFFQLDRIADVQDCPESATVDKCWREQGLNPLLAHLTSFPYDSQSSHEYHKVKVFVKHKFWVRRQLDIMALPRFESWTRMYAAQRPVRGTRILIVEMVVYKKIRNKKFKFIRSAIEIHEPATIGEMMDRWQAHRRLPEMHST